MSDTESASGGPLSIRPTIGGKSLEVLQRPRYKSWRKKYRKMRVGFDATLEENKRLFREEHKLQVIAKRLREELDGLLELCLEFNQKPDVPAELRFDVRLPRHLSREGPNKATELTPEIADAIILEAQLGVAQRKIPLMEQMAIQEEMAERLAMLNVRRLVDMEKASQLPFIGEETTLPIDWQEDDQPGFLTEKEEAMMMRRLEQSLATIPSLAVPAPIKVEDDKSTANLAPKELDRQSEILNPQSQYNWLKANTKMHSEGGEDAETVAHAETKPARKRASAKNLAKQVGDRAIEKAREGHSPGGGSLIDDDELSLGFIDDHPAVSSGKKKAKDPDGPYRSKAGRNSGVSAAKNKRKRNSGGDGMATPTNAGSKKIKVSPSRD